MVVAVAFVVVVVDVVVVVVVVAFAVADKHYFYHGLKPPYFAVFCRDLPLYTLTNGCIDSVKIRGN